MANENFIPGPWYAEFTIGGGGINATVYDASGRYHICMSSTDNEKLYDTVKGNCYLMAAAPAMYAELKNICDKCRKENPDIDCVKNKCHISEILATARGEGEE